MNMSYYASNSRVTGGPGFPFWPGMDIPAGALYADATTGQFGHNAILTKKNEKGFADPTGVIRFKKPTSWVSKDKQKVFYTPTDEANGTFTTATATGAICVGWEVFPPAGVIHDWNTTDFIYVELQRGL